MAKKVPYLCCDEKLGFPLIGDGMGHEISFLPVTKIQFETYCLEVGSVSPAAFQSMLDVNKAVSSKSFVSGQRERLFITGVLPEEAEGFTNWLGPSYTLPTAVEWIAIRNWLTDIAVEQRTLIALAETPMSIDARIIVDRLLRVVQPLNWSELTFLQDGVMEWVRKEGNVALLGSTRSEFYPLNSIPDADHPHVLADAAAKRQRIVGFRYIRSAKPRSS